MKEKAIIGFKQNNQRRGKQAFFNLVNEALAYEYLLGVGYSHVKLLKEKTVGKTPDIYFQNGTLKCYCEVKTIGVSEEEIDRKESNDIFSGTVYRELNTGYFNKLSSDIDRSILQIPDDTSIKLIYIICHFDDMILSHLPTYLDQIKVFFDENYPIVEICVRQSINNKHIFHRVAKST